MNIPENILSTLTDEQKKQVEAAKTPEELLALGKQFGTELSLDQLEGVSGGQQQFGCRNDAHCHDKKIYATPIL